MTIRSPRSFISARSGTRTFLEIGVIGASLTSSEPRNARGIWDDPDVRVIRLRGCSSHRTCLSAALQRRRHAVTICSELEKPDEHLVLLLSELIDRPTGGLAHDAVDDRLLERGRDVGSAKGFHHALERIH